MYIRITSCSESYYSDNTHRSEPCKALLIAILQRAVADLYQYYRPFRASFGTSRGQFRALKREIIGYFFISKNAEYGSFFYICDELGIDRGSFRKYLKDRIIELERGEVLYSPMWGFN